MTDNGWQERLHDMVTDQKIPRYLIQTRMDEQYRPLIKEAARRRGMQPAHYFRRCVLAFVAHDLGIDFLELASLEPPMREKDDLPPRRFGGKGFGKWRIRKLER